MKFYLKPAIQGESYGKTWDKWNPGQFTEFKNTIKKAFCPVHGSGTNAHFPINYYALPHPFGISDIDIGFCSHKGQRWNLSIERTPGASITAFGFTEFSLRITEQGYRKNGTKE